MLSRLLHYEMSPALLSDLDERVTGHILHTLVRFVHELEEFVHDRLQEFPMGFQEARVLTDDVHDIGGDDGFVVLSTFDLA